MLIKFIKLQCYNGAIYKIPISIVAYSRAKYYSHEYDDDIERSLKEDTLPLFESDDYEIYGWLKNNMDFEEIQDHLIKVRDADEESIEALYKNAMLGGIK